MQNWNKHTAIWVVEVHQERDLFVSEAILLNQMRSVDFAFSTSPFFLVPYDGASVICSRHIEDWVGVGIDAEGNKVRTYHTGEPILTYTRTGVQQHAQNRLTIDIAMECPCPTTPFFLSEVPLHSLSHYDLCIGLSIDTWADTPDLQANYRLFQRQNEELRDKPIGRMLEPARPGEDRFLYRAHKYRPDAGDCLPVSFLVNDVEVLAILQLTKQVDHHVFLANLHLLQEIARPVDGTVLMRKVRWFEDGIEMIMERSIAIIRSEHA